MKYIAAKFALIILLLVQKGKCKQYWPKYENLGPKTSLHLVVPFYYATHITTVSNC